MARFRATPTHLITSTRRWFTVTPRALIHAAASDGPICLPPIALPPPPVVLSCTCGRKFNSDNSLRDHQKAKAKTKAGILRCSAQPAKGRKWLWKHVCAEKPIRRIEFTAVEPSDTPVSSTSASELVCSYNWRRRGARFHVPGAAPIWQSRTLPLALRQDRGVTFRDQNAARVPQSPFKPLFEATVAMNPSFRFDDVDVLVDRTSLCRLLDFSAGRRQDSFRLNLHLVRRTLIIERSDKSARAYISAAAKNPGWGKGFEDNFTRYARPWTDSASHHRALRYQFGDLLCVVRFEVDACFSKAEGRLTANPIPTKDPSVIQRLHPKAPRGQAWLAEIKTASRNGPSISDCLPQVWFGRTPWLIMGRHQKGNFKTVDITHMEAKFPLWETQHQKSLRKMATILAQLRRAVEENGGEHCVAICEKRGLPPAINVFPSDFPRKTVSDHLRRKLWHAEKAGAPVGEMSTVNIVNREGAME